VIYVKEVIERFSFATFITVSAEGPFVSHLPQNQGPEGKAVAEYMQRVMTSSSVDA
jgi:hypothetical protein